MDEKPIADCVDVATIYHAQGVALVRGRDTVIIHTREGKMYMIRPGGVPLVLITLKYLIRTYCMFRYVPSVDGTVFWFRRCG